MTKQEKKYFDEVVACLKEHGITCVEGKKNKDTGVCEGYELKGEGEKEKVFRTRFGWDDTANNGKGAMIMRHSMIIKGSKDVTANDMTSAIVESVTARMANSCTSESRELIHQLHLIRENNHIETKKHISFGAID